MSEHARKTGSRLSLGPAGVVFVVVASLILAAAVYTQANLLYWAFGLMIGGLVISVAWSLAALRGIQARRLPPGHAVAGEPAVLRYHLTNRSRLAVFSLTVHETWGRGPRGWRRAGPLAADPPLLLGRPVGWVLHLGPGQTAQAEAPCHPRARGTLALSHIVVGTSFPFSIVRKAVHFDQPARMPIYPHLYRLNPRVIPTLARAEAGGRKHADRRGGAEEFYGLREYRPGDSLKLIDWKRSARGRRLVCREMTRPAPPKVMVHLDLTSPPDRPGEASGGGGEDHREVGAPADRDLMERAISLAASVICEAYLHGYPVGLAVIGRDCPTFPVRHVPPHRARMLEALTALDLSRPAQAPLPAGAPSVIIRAQAASSPGPPPSRATVLGARAIEQYVIESQPHAPLTR